MSRGDRTTDLFVILQGRVRVVLENDDGEEFVLNELGAGESFGEVSLVDGMPRTATVLPEDDCLLAVLSRTRLIALIRREPMIAMDLLASIVNLLRKGTQREERLAFLDVRERLCRLFLQEAMAEGRKDKSGFFRVRKRTHRDLAARIGSSREAVTKTLKTLAKQELLRERKEDLLVSPAICRKLSVAQARRGRQAPGRETRRSAPGSARPDP